MTAACGDAVRFHATLRRLRTQRDGPSPDVARHLAALDSARVRSGVSRRRAQGAHYTPPQLVDFVIAETLRGWRPSRRDWALIDPACGAGSFLVAAARALAGRTGEPMSRILERRVAGIDIDPVAVRLARRELLGLLPSRTGEAARRRIRASLARSIIVADALDEAPGAGTGRLFDLVLGNPPFLNQLEKGTAASRARALRIAKRTGGAVRRYADHSSAFLLNGLERLAPGGRLGFVMPQSFLSTADARPARDAAVRLAGLRSIWTANESMFEGASVRVAALVFVRGPARSLRRAFGGEFAAIRGSVVPPRPGDESWATLLAEGFGAPRLEFGPNRGTVGDIARATADFRDQYYGLRGAIEEGGPGPRLATTRHIDLARCSWGEREVRVLGERYLRPTVDRRVLEGVRGMEAWLDARLVPKLIVATQTRVIEAFVDAHGEYAPLVPLITVVPRAKIDLWSLAAAVASPVVAARALALYAGSALGAGAIKLSARQLVAMPLPVDRAAWSRSSERLKAGDLDAFAAESCAAHRLGASDAADVLAFWRGRAGKGTAPA